MESFSNKRVKQYLRDVLLLFKEATEETISNEEIASRLTELKAERKKLELSGEYPINQPIPLEKDKDMTPRTQKGLPSPAVDSKLAKHALDFKCQCSSCVGMYTITMEDKNYLKELHIVWNDPKKSAKANSLVEK